VGRSDRSEDHSLRATRRVSHVAGVTDLGAAIDKSGQSGIGLSFIETTPAHTLTILCASLERRTPT
jgi:hypothetical protein